MSAAHAISMLLYIGRLVGDGGGSRDAGREGERCVPGLDYAAAEFAHGIAFFR